MANSRDRRLRLALIAGGISGEREVSLAGAREVEKALDRRKYDVVRFDPATDLVRLAEESDRLDVAFVLLHGRFGEDGTIQGFLELLGVPYQGAGVLGSALAMDKHMAKECYRAHGLPTPPWRLLRSGHRERPEELAREVGLPLVVKPARQGSSIGMRIVRTAEETASALEAAFAADDSVLLERFVQGRELTGGVLGNETLTPLPLVEIVPGEAHEFFDYAAKYTPGASREICPAPLDEAITAKAQEFACRAHQALQLRGYSRTDMILAEDGSLYLLETNTIPGMTPTSLLPQAAREAGLSFSALLDRLIELAIEAADKQAGVDP